MEDRASNHLRDAEALRNLGRFSESQARYEAALKEAPGDVRALAGLGLLALQTDRPDLAVERLSQAIAAGADSSHLRNALGIALRRMGRQEEAVAAYDQAIALNPDYAEGHGNRGNALLDLKRAAEALDSFDRALALRGDSPRFHCNRGLALLALEQFQAALDSFDAALSIAADDVSAHLGRSNALIGLDRLDEALTALDQTLRLQPRHAKALHNRGLIQCLTHQYGAALISFEAALALSPDDPESLTGRGEALRRMGQLEAATASFDTALALRPDLPDALFNRALVRLTQGRFAESWDDYENRWRTTAFLKGSAGCMTTELMTRRTERLGRADLIGRRVLVVAEQGVGDVLMFASMLPELIADAGSVALICERRLHRLFAISFPGLTLIAPLGPSSAPIDYDFVLPIGSLTGLYRRRREDFSGRPYLTASVETRDRWTRALGPRTTPLRIGISWKGGLPSTGQSLRSMTLEDLRPILESPRCEVVNLQYGDPRPEIAAINATLSRPIRVFEPEAIADFEDLAALVQELDLIVSVQTAVVHLAGALGRPTLAMVPPVAEWRYGASGPHMPWYTSVELFRQPIGRSWGSVVEQVAARLAADA